MFFSILNFFGKILVFRTLRLCQLQTLSVRQDLFQFYPSDVDKIWYAPPYIHQYAWTVFLDFQFFLTIYSFFSDSATCQIQTSNAAFFFQTKNTKTRSTCRLRRNCASGDTFNPFMPTVAFNICCPSDCVSRTANVERNGGNKWLRLYRP